MMRLALPERAAELSAEQADQLRRLLFADLATVAEDLAERAHTASVDATCGAEAEALHRRTLADVTRLLDQLGWAS